MLGEFALCSPQSPGLPAYVTLGRTRRSGKQCAPCAAPCVQACYKQGAGVASFLDPTLTSCKTACAQTSSTNGLTTVPYDTNLRPNTTCVPSVGRACTCGVGL